MHLQQTLLYAPFLQYTTHSIENLKQRCAETFRYFWQETGAHLKSTHLWWLLLRVIPTSSMYTRESLRVAHEGAEGSHDKFLVKGRRSGDCVAIFSKETFTPLRPLYIHPTPIQHPCSVLRPSRSHSLSLSLYGGRRRMKRQCTWSGGSPANSQKERFATFSSCPELEQMHPSSFAIVSDRNVIMVHSGVI